MRVSKTHFRERKVLKIASVCHNLAKCISLLNPDISILVSFNEMNDGCLSCDSFSFLSFLRILNAYASVCERLGLTFRSVLHHGIYIL
jgi:hypothetical protein